MEALKPKNHKKKGINKQTLKNVFLSEYFILILSILYFICVIPFAPRIIMRSNLLNLLSNMWPLLVIAIGQTYVLLLGGIDLSQVSVIGVTSVIGTALMSNNFDPNIFSKTPLWGWLINENGGPLAGNVMAVPISILIMLVIGTLIGLFNGFFVANFRMPPFMVTLVTQMFLLSFAIYLTQSRNIMGLPESFSEFGKGGFGIFSYAAIFTIVIAVIASIILSQLVLEKEL